MKSDEKETAAALGITLAIPERMALLGILPDQGNFADLKVTQKLRMDLSFSDQEFKDWDIRSVITYNWSTGDEKGTVVARNEDEARDILKKELPAAKKLKLVVDDKIPGQIAWGGPGLDPTTFTRTFNFGKRSTEIIISALKKFDSEGRLTPHHISVYEKFITTEESET